mgnify:CR=1 FL=1
MFPKSDERNDFEYSLGDGQGASIFGGSVESEGEKIDSSNLDLDIKDGTAIVSTEYYIEEKGFGEEYVGDKKLKLNVDLADFGLIAENSSVLSIKIVYGAETFVEIEEDVAVTQNPFIQVKESVNETIKFAKKVKENKKYKIHKNR